MIYAQLFWSFLQIGMFSVGGGYAAMPLIQSQVVELHHWLTMSEFADLVTIAEMTPGPIAVNGATFVGMRIAGFSGSLVAITGCLLPSCILLSILYYFYRRYQKAEGLQQIMGSLRPAVVAMIASAGLNILGQVLWQGQKMQLANVQWTGALLFVGAFAILRIKKWNPILVLCLCGAVGLAVGLLTGQTV